MESNVQVDRYTKFILTVIAVCLIFICLRGINLTPLLYGSPQDTLDVRIKAIERGPGQSWDSVIIGSMDTLPVEVENAIAIPVEVKNPLLAVDVKNVEVKSSLKPVEVKD